MKYTVSFSLKLKPTDRFAVEISQGIMHLRYSDDHVPESIGEVEKDAGEILDRMLHEGEFYDIHVITDNVQTVDCEPED